MLGCVFIYPLLTLPKGKTKHLTFIEPKMKSFSCLFCPFNKPKPKLIQFVKMKKTIKGNMLLPFSRP